MLNEKARGYCMYVFLVSDLETRTRIFLGHIILYNSNSNARKKLSF